MFERYKTLIYYNSGHSFVSFNEGLAAGWEDYKPRLRSHALNILKLSEWSDKNIGTGAILECAIDAIEIQDNHVNLTNNLVFWQNRYGHANRAHRALLEA